MTNDSEFVGNQSLQEALEGLVIGLIRSGLIRVEEETELNVVNEH